MGAVNVGIIGGIVGERLNCFGGRPFFDPDGSCRSSIPITR